MAERTIVDEDEKVLAVGEEKAPHYSNAIVLLCFLLFSFLFKFICDLLEMDKCYSPAFKDLLVSSLNLRRILSSVHQPSRETILM